MYKLQQPIIGKVKTIAGTPGMTLGVRNQKKGRNCTKG